MKARSRSPARATPTASSPIRASTSNITNSGTIRIDEDYTPTDTDKDGDLDGLFAQGSNRFGIRVGPGGDFTGNIINSGTIAVEGNSSAGIRIDSRLVGSLTSSGTVSLTGNNGHGIRAGDVTGNVRLSGTIQVQGGNSVGVDLTGDIGGALVVQGTIASTGYRSIFPPADPSKLDADDLLQGGPALRIGGDVAGGILFDVPPADNSSTDTDEDDDGVPDAQEGSAAVRSHGAAPAVEIGAAGEDIVIGAVGTSGQGIINRGVISGNGSYSGIAGNGLVIGGQGGTVQVTGGLTNAGTISASANGGNATALRVGSGASVPTITNSGIISANGGGTAAGSAVAIRTDAGATVTTIRNTGQIAADVGTSGSATAILDQAGTVALVENSGVISASGGTATAIDLSQNGGGATVRQLAGSGTRRIGGNILFGSGNDVLDIAGGSVVGNTSFGAGADRLSLAGSSSYSGNVDFGGGADLLSVAGTSSFTGRLTGSSGVAATVNGGLLNATNQGNVALASLDVAGGGGLGVTIDSAAGTHTRYDVAGQASFASGSRLIVNLTSTVGSEGTFVVLQAGTLAGGGNLQLETPVLPYLFVGTVAADETADRISLNIRRRTASELGLNRSESGAYAAVFDALGEDDLIESVFLGAANQSQIRAAIQQMMPNHAGGVFETVTQGSRATARFLSDPRAPVLDMGGWGFFLQQVGWGTSKDLGDTSAYDISGWGASGGAEVRLGGAGALGLSLSYLLGTDADGSNDNQVRTSQYELAAYWRGSWGGLSAFARGSAARIDFDGIRRFAAGAVTRETQGDWSGTLLSASGGLSYEIRSGRLSIRPLATIDYYRLSETGYAETGGGAGFDLAVAERDSDELAATGSLTLGYDISGGSEPDSSFFRIEIEGGRRQILSGALGATRARFGDGDEFVLLAEERESGWLGRLRLLGGTRQFRIGGEVGAEEQAGRAAVAFRLSLHSAF